MGWLGATFQRSGSSSSASTSSTSNRSATSERDSYKENRPHTATPWHSRQSLLTSVPDIGYRYLMDIVRDFKRGAVQLHVLFHAAQGEIHGSEMIEELSRHGHRLSPGTLYPMLH